MKRWPPHCNLQFKIYSLYDSSSILYCTTSCPHKYFIQNSIIDTFVRESICLCQPKSSQLNDSYILRICVLKLYFYVGEMYSTLAPTSVFLLSQCSPPSVSPLCQFTSDLSPTHSPVVIMFAVGPEPEIPVFLIVQRLSEK